jgi:hypothetical protein
MTRWMPFLSNPMIIFEAPYKAVSFKRHPAIKCTVELLPWHPWRKQIEGVDTVRTIFNIEIKTDLPAYDIERRQALIELFRRTSSTLYTQATMLSKGVPVSMSITSHDNENGTEKHPIFDIEKETN